MNRQCDTWQGVCGFVASVKYFLSNWTEIIIQGKETQKNPCNYDQRCWLDRTKVTLLGCTDQELGSMVKVKNKQLHREQTTREHVSKGTVNVRPHLTVTPWHEPTPIVVTVGPDIAAAAMTAQ